MGKKEFDLNREVQKTLIGLCHAAAAEAAEGNAAGAKEIIRVEDELVEIVTKSVKLAQTDTTPKP